MIFRIPGILIIVKMLWIFWRTPFHLAGAHWEALNLWWIDSGLITGKRKLMGIFWFYIYRDIRPMRVVFSKSKWFFGPKWSFGWRIDDFRSQTTGYHSNLGAPVLLILPSKIKSWFCSWLTPISSFFLLLKKCMFSFFYASFSGSEKPEKNVRRCSSSMKIETIKSFSNKWFKS